MNKSIKDNTSADKTRAESQKRKARRVNLKAERLAKKQKRARKEMERRREPESGIKETNERKFKIIKEAKHGTINRNGKPLDKADKQRSVKTNKPIRKMEPHHPNSTPTTPECITDTK